MGKKDKNRENGCEKSEDTIGRGVEYLTFLLQKSVRFLPVPPPPRLTELSVTIYPLWRSMTMTPSSVQKGLHKLRKEKRKGLRNAITAM
ncbi:unnamed protein product [Brugia pahangi]|uniref:Uncharacterized protein n=1 Tax=Brugia pahangi TaxID=6280 RepID=A0A0N4TUP9_BRUPA|nr:unnamed protein product [Brugia pahangi]